MQYLPIEQIEATTATQVRVKLNKDVIELYEKDITNGADMPPVEVYCESGSERYILADGFHRLLAHVNAGVEEIAVDVKEGGMAEALLAALGANTEHGLRRSNADKVHAVEMCLKDPALSQRTQAEIADICRVHINTVQRVATKQVAPKGKNTPKVDPKDPTPEDHRPTKPAPTQQEVELEEVRAALGAIKVLPYDGETAAAGLDFDKDDIADLEYVSTWCAHAVMAYRKGVSDGD